MASSNSYYTSFPGGSFELVKRYLEGATIMFHDKIVPPYKEPDDIFRLSHSEFTFKVIRKVETRYYQHFYRESLLQCDEDDCPTLSIDIDIETQQILSTKVLAQ